MGWGVCRNPHHKGTENKQTNKKQRHRKRTQVFSKMEFGGHICLLSEL